MTHKARELRLLCAVIGREERKIRHDTDLADTDITVNQPRSGRNNVRLTEIRLKDMRLYWGTLVW